MQAPFSISLTAPASQAVLSNARLASRVPVSEGLALHTFEQTPPMSTYLVAFVIGNLTNVSALVPGRTPFDEARTVSIWATPHRWAAKYWKKLAKWYSSGEVTSQKSARLCASATAPYQQFSILHQSAPLCLNCLLWASAQAQGGKAMTEPCAAQR